MRSSKPSEEQLQTLEGLAAIALKFGRIRRLTADDKGLKETDTTHTVMLMLCIEYLAHTGLLPEGFEVGTALRYALVHDLPETYAGDTPTLRGLSPKERAAKELREKEAMDKILNDLPDSSWLEFLHIAYESQIPVEARVVYFLDKLMPKLTHVVNGASVIHEEGIDADEFAVILRDQEKDLRSRFPELKALHALFSALSSRTQAAFRDAK